MKYLLFLLFPILLYGQYKEGVIVEIEAVPDSGSQFVGWGGDLFGAPNPVNMVVDKETEAIAIFESEATEYEININVSGDGNVLIKELIDIAALEIVPPATAIPGEVFGVDIDIGEVTNLQVVSFELKYTDLPNYINGYSIGNFWAGTNADATVIPRAPISETDASVYIIYGSQSGAGTIITLQFQIPASATRGQVIDWWIGVYLANAYGGEVISLQTGTAQTRIE